MSERATVEPDPDRPETWIPEPQRDEQAKPNGQDHPADDAARFAPKPWVYRDPTTIQPREWLLGTTLLRGYATVLGSMGGVGKTAYAIACALTVITGRRDIIGQHVFHRGNAWFITLEDNRLELERRIAAAMIAHGVRPEEIEGHLFVNDNASDEPLLLAQADEKGAFVIGADAERIKTGITQKNILLTVIDPLVKAHHAIENSNDHQDRLIALANDMARDTHSAIVLPCHFRKGGGEGGARDAIRGGSAFIDGARVTRTLIQMTPADAKAFNIPPEDAFRYVRIQDPKANMAPRQAAAWFQLAPIPLGNTDVDPTYPAGDNVQAAMPWQPPTTFEGVDAGVLRRIFARLSTEPEPGWFYSPTPQAKFWAGTVIMEEAAKSRVQAAQVLAKWIENDVLIQQHYTTPSRSDGTKLIPNEAKIAAMLAPLRAFGEDDA